MSATSHLISPQKAKDWLDKDEAILIDVREPGEHGASFIEHSILKPMGQITAADLRPLGARFILHCHKGARASGVIKHLQKEDKSLELYNLEGGLEGWKRAGLPVQRGGKSILPLDRQVHILIGILLITFSLLSALVHPVFILATGLIGCGLLNAGLTGWCGMAKLLAKMPYNQ